MAERIIDMSDAVKRVEFLNQLRRLSGRYRFDITRYRPRRTDRQNRYYWPCFVKPLGDYLRDQGETITDAEVHKILKHKFLRRSVVSSRTGKVGEYVPSTSSLDTSEFNIYLDQCSAWLSDMFGIIVPEPNDYHEQADHRHQGQD